MSRAVRPPAREAEAGAAEPSGACWTIVVVSLLADGADAEEDAGGHAATDHGSGQRDHDRTRGHDMVERGRRP